MKRIVKVVDIHEGLESTLIMLAHQFEGGNGHPCIDVQKEYGQLPDVECYPGALNQVFLNILTNAVEALVTRDDSNIPNTIAISTGIVQMDGEEWVAIAIVDNGDGIPKSLQTKIFDPFFTTKDVGTGTGGTGHQSSDHCGAAQWTPPMSIQVGGRNPICDYIAHKNERWTPKDKCTDRKSFWAESISGENTREIAPKISTMSCRCRSKVRVG